MTTKGITLIISIIIFFTLAFAVVGQESIGYAQVVTGEITESTPNVSYRFNGMAGDTIIIRMSATGEQTLDSYVTLLDTEGNFFYSDDDSGGMRNALLGPVVLPSTGIYTIIASSCCDSSIAGTTGTYELVVEQVQIPVVAPNQSVNFELSNSNPVVFFILAGNSVPSQVARAVVNVIRAPMTDTWNISLDVRSPLGNNFYSSYAPAGSNRYVLDPIIANVVDGSYQIRVNVYSENGDTPILPEGESIQANLVIEEIPVTPLALGSSVSGTLNDNTPSLYYTFLGDMRDLFSLVGKQPTDSYAINVTIYDTFGFSITGAGTINYMDGSNLGGFVIDPLRTMNEGTYFIGVSRASFSIPEDVMGKTSIFTLSLDVTKTPVLQVGVPVTGVLDNLEKYEHVYRYQATANQTIRITLTSLNDGYAPTFDLIGEAFESPDTNIANINSVAPGKLIYEVTLYYDGIYLIYVRNNIFYSFENVAGEYSLQIDVVK